MHVNSKKYNIIVYNIIFIFRDVGMLCIVIMFSYVAYLQILLLACLFNYFSNFLRVGTCQLYVPCGRFKRNFI